MVTLTAMTASGLGDWRWYLAEYLSELGPNPRGRFLPEPAEDDERVSGEALLDPGYLRASIDRAGPTDPHPGNPNDRDPRIGVSRMTREYCASLTCVALAGLANGVGIDLSPARCVAIFRSNVPMLLSLNPAPVVRCAERPASWPVAGPAVATVEELREFVWTNLYARNLGVLFSTAVGMVNVPERFLWTNAAEWVAMVMDAAIEYLEPAAAAPIVAECRALLDADSLPGFVGNPLRGLLEWQPFDGAGIQTRHLCCLLYLHTDRDGRLCQNCPFLPLPDRAALIRERHGVGMANPTGPAERRSRELGLDRRRF